MARNYTELDLIRLAIREQLLDLHTMIPAKIESYDSSTQKATVVVSINRGINNKVFPPAKLFNVKVAFPRMGDRGVSYEVKVGDSVLLGFAHRDLTQWASAGEGFGPNTNDICPLSSAVVIAGLSPDLQTFTQKQGVTELVGDKVFIGKPSEKASALAKQTGTTVSDVLSYLPATVPAEPKIKFQPNLSATTKLYTTGNIDLVSILINLVDNLINAAYGGNTLFGGAAGSPVAAIATDINQIDKETAANLGKIVEDLKKLKASN